MIWNDSNFIPVTVSDATTHVVSSDSKLSEVPGIYGDTDALVYKLDISSMSEPAVYRFGTDSSGVSRFNDFSVENSDFIESNLEFSINKAETYHFTICKIGGQIWLRQVVAQ